MLVEQKLQALGLELPDPERVYRVNASGAHFVSHLAVGNMLYVSGTCAVKDGQPFRRGVVGESLSLGEGYEAARYALLPTLGVIKYALGDLISALRVIRDALDRRRAGVNLVHRSLVVGSQDRLRALRAHGVGHAPSMPWARAVCVVARRVSDLKPRHYAPAGPF